MYVEYELVHQGGKNDPSQYKFLVHSKMDGHGCRPTLTIQVLPGQGSLGKKMLYDFSEPLPDPSSHLQPNAQQNIEPIPGAHTNKLHALYVTRPVPKASSNLQRHAQKNLEIIPGSYTNKLIVILSDPRIIFHSFVIIR